jgi:hypothetical protein
LSIDINHSTNTIKSQSKLTIEADAEVSVTNNRITEVNDPVADQDAVNKRFLEQAISINIADSKFLYTNTTPMPEEVGGYEPGNTFESATLEQLFTNLLYPYQYPSVTAFSISGQATILEVGDSISGGNRIFSWNISNDLNVSANSIAIEDVTSGVIYGTSYANDNSQIIDIGADIVKNSTEINAWKISARNTRNQTISRNFNVNWRWRTYYGTSDNETLTETEIKSLVSSSLDSNFTGNKSVAGGGYKYFAYPTEFGLKTNFQDVVNGFAVAMQPALTVSIENDYGVSTDYYVHRTTNPIVGSLIVAVS